MQYHNVLSSVYFVNQIVGQSCKEAISFYVQYSAYFMNFLFDEIVCYSIVHTIDDIDIIIKDELKH